MSFFKSIFRIAAPILGAFLGGPIGAAIGGAGASALTGGKPLDDLKAGAISGIGSYLSGPALSSAGSNFGATSALASATGSGGVSSFLQGVGSAGGDLLSSATSSIPSALSAINGVSSIANAVMGGGRQSSPTASQPMPSSAASAAPTPFSPTRPDAMSAPNSLSAFASFAPDQQRSAIATKGVNSGLSTDEDSYYRNLVQRSLIGGDNKVTDNPNALLPVEDQYFARKGVSTSNLNDLLKAIQPTA